MGNELKTASDLRWVLLLGLLGLCLLLPGIFHLPLVDRDEPRFARAAVEMLERGDFFVPWFNGDFRFDKPPLTYWLMFPGLAMFGESEWVVRLPSVLSAIGCGLLMFQLARRMGIDRKIAMVVCAGWLSCLQVMIHGRLSVADMHLCFFLVLTMLAMWELRSSRVMWRSVWFHVLWLAMGFGFLAKGPLALALPLVALLVCAGLERWKREPEERVALGLLRYWLYAVPLALGLVALWGIPALMMTRGLYFDVGIGTHVVERGMDGFNKRKHVPLVYYPLMLPLFIAPWTALLPSLKFGSERKTEGDFFLLGWVLAPFLVFTFYATQLPHYILPAYPALFVLLALKYKEKREAFGIWMKILVALPVLVFSVLGVLLWWGASRAAGLDAGLVGLLFWMGCLLMLVAAACVLVWRRNFVIAVFIMICAAVCVQMTSMHAEKLHVVNRLMTAVGEMGKRPASAGFSEPSLVWYGSEKWKFGNQVNADTDLQVVAGRRWRLDDQTFKAIWSGNMPQPVKQRSAGYLGEIPENAKSVTGWSIADGSWVELWYWKKDN